MDIAQDAISENPQIRDYTYWRQASTVFSLAEN